MSSKHFTVLTGPWNARRAPKCRHTGGSTPPEPAALPYETTAFDPAPIPFDRLSLDNRLLSGIRDLGWHETRSIQSGVIPFALAAPDSRFGIAVLVVLHALAALKHHVVDRDRVLMRTGVKAEQLEGVRGYAATRPRFPERTTDAGNRRISIVVRREDRRPT